MEKGSFVILTRNAHDGKEHMILPAPTEASGRILARAAAAAAAQGAKGGVSVRAYPFDHGG